MSKQIHIRYRRKSTVLSQLIDTVSGIPGGSDFINGRLGNVLFKRLRQVRVDD